MIDGFKYFVRNGEMTISLGVGVALFEPEEQQMILETMGEDFNAHQINRMIKDQTFDLEKASFDAPLANRKMADCTPEEQIIKINEREIRKKQIENNKQFEEVVQMIRETEYINMKKTLSTDEMVAFSISLFENNVDYMSQQKYFSKFLGDTSKRTKVEMVENFKKKFKKEIFHKLIRYMLTKQVHFGESNHVNNLTNISFYNAMKGYYKSKIADIEKEYTKKRDKREARLK